MTGLVVCVLFCFCAEAARSPPQAISVRKLCALSDLKASTGSMRWLSSDSGISFFLISSEIFVLSFLLLLLLALRGDS